LSADGARVLSGSGDSVVSGAGYEPPTLKLWDAATGALLRT
jgi:hypothetical protein